MREIRPSGSEGGAAQPNEPSLPLSFRRATIIEYVTRARNGLQSQIRN